MSSTECCHCKKTGHLSSECPNKGSCANIGNDSKDDVKRGAYGAFNKGPICFNCGTAGHFSRNCPKNDTNNAGAGKYSRDGNGNGSKRDFVFKSGDSAFEGPSRHGLTCNNCGKTGHMLRNCPDNENSADSGNERGCDVNTADGSETYGRYKGQPTCYNCGKDGHMKRNCPEYGGSNSEHGNVKSPIICHQCGTPGHISRHCNKFGNSGENLGTLDRSLRCYECQERGHLSKDCLKRTNTLR
ncbi:zinc knuckle domain-containing protein [Ditylenchus destructor]|uniref:Zinc knuckle domain-containing protein n=1 Tax=Ditylenchus destructor TaxID=166010 RepID=A0AAD4N088_9BILA|nr:zinc knuckle domain-containing protein [Ditylenchus destructor]